MTVTRTTSYVGHYIVEKFTGTGSLTLDHLDWYLVEYLENSLYPTFDAP